jgi:hypothetical protein
MDRPRSQRFLALSGKSRPERRCRLEQLEGRTLLAGDMVTAWNDATIAAQRADTTSPGPGWSARNFAIVHLAIFDAVNAITQTHASFALMQQAPSDASLDAAVAQAARDALAALYPAQTATFDGLLAASLAGVPDGPQEDAGVAIGKLAAAAVVGLRTGDGSAVIAPYTVDPDPGHWRPDPLHPEQIVWGPGWGDVTEFGMRDVGDFEIPPPPAMDTAAYAAAYEEVRLLGEVDSTVRTADQTEIGLFWAYDRGGFGPPTVLYNQNVQAISAARGNTLVENARLFALVNMAMADAATAIWHEKFRHDFWRPIEGIRRGDEDGNPATLADAEWTPLGAPGDDPLGTADDFTPPFPAYSSGHAGIGAATFKMLAHFYGEDYADAADAYDFTLTSEEVPGAVRSFESFAQAAEENGKSRIYLGIHWEFDNQLGQQQGREIADDLFDHLLVPHGVQTTVAMQMQGSGFRVLQLPAGVDVRIERRGPSLQVLDMDAGRVLFTEPLAEVASLAIDARNAAADSVTIDRTLVAHMNQPIQLHYLSAAGEQDELIVLGKGTSNELTLDGDELAIGESGLSARLAGVEQVELRSGGGGDILRVLGDQTGRTLKLVGDRGRDEYVIGSSGAQIVLIDLGLGSGRDTLDFSLAAAPVTADLGLMFGQEQPAAGGNALRIFGLIENLVGSEQDDTLRGNLLANAIDGRGGNDIISGVLGDDDLAGGAGFDLVIGGLGLDHLDGTSGDDLLIGGRTTHDDDHAALDAILAEWSSGRELAVRIANLTHGGGSAERLNGSTFLTVGAGGTVRDDDSRDTFDLGPASNWVLSDRKDKLRS